MLPSRFPLTFREVAHERSLSRAARTLSLTQPSVSHQIAQLEREVGGKAAGALSRRQQHAGALVTVGIARDQLAIRALEALTDAARALNR